MEPGIPGMDPGIPGMVPGIEGGPLPYGIPPGMMLPGRSLPIGGDGGAGAANGPPAQTPSPGDAMHAGSAGPVGNPGPLPSQPTNSGAATQLGWSALGSAFAWPTAPIAAIPMSTAATASLMIAPHVKDRSSHGCLLRDAEPNFPRVLVN
ncbi:hypothetical protein MAGR_64350 [Mycolicibacterium agri]|uniref:Uncharacterized protein n=1 Tax=Mycolicibacterium agri TaxID=36811 RepID=A0A7I9WBG4_MYCAG|nr:hypothetical protein MAGR_64350 [Mycolicibacterium agri]